MRFREMATGILIVAAGCGGSPPPTTTNAPRCAATAPPAWALLVRALAARVCTVDDAHIELEIADAEMEREMGHIDAFASDANWVARDVWIEEDRPPVVGSRSYVDGSRALAFELQATSPDALDVRVSIVDPATLPPDPALEPSGAGENEEEPNCEVPNEGETMEQFMARCESEWN
jgi:hypothetical protein